MERLHPKLRNAADRCFSEENGPGYILGGLSAKDVSGFENNDAGD